MISMYENMRNNGYSVIKLLSSGSYGDCYVVQKENRSGSLILKVYKTTTDSECEHELKVYNELHDTGLGKEWLFNVEPSNIGGKKCLLIGTYDGNTMEEYFFHSDEKSFDKKLEILIKSCEVVSEMHKSSCPYVHLDIKPSNFYISENKEYLKPIDMGSAVSLCEKYAENITINQIMSEFGYASTKEYATKKIREFNKIRNKIRTQKIDNVSYLASESDKEKLVKLWKSISIKDDIYSLLLCVFDVFTGGEKRDFWLYNDKSGNDLCLELVDIFKNSKLPEYCISPMVDLFMKLEGPSQDVTKDIDFKSVDQLIEKLNDLKEIYENKGFHPEVLLRNSRNYFEKHFSNVEIDHELLCEIEKG